MGRVRVDVLRVGSGTGTKSKGTGIPVLPVRTSFFTMLELYRMFFISFLNVTYDKFETIIV